MPIKKISFIAIIIMSVLYSNSFFAMDDNTQLIIHQPVNNCHSSCSYNYCQQSYTVWPCQERFDRAKPYIALCSICLVSREVATIGYSLRDNRSCGEIHKMVWGSKDMWTSCHCDSSNDILCSVVSNCTTAITAVALLKSLCIFAPWCTDSE